jgi:hypothetical protein
MKKGMIGKIEGRKKERKKAGGGCRVSGGNEMHIFVSNMFINMADISMMWYIDDVGLC